MKRLCFEDYESLAYDIDENYTRLQGHDDLTDVSVIGFYKDIKNVLKYLITFDYDIASIDLEEPEINGYEKEFILSIDSVGCIWVDKLWNDNKYLNYESNITFIFDDCNSAVINASLGGCLVEVAISTECNSISFKDYDKEYNKEELVDIYKKIIEDVQKPNNCEINIEFECPRECDGCCDNSDLGYSVTVMTPDEANKLIEEIDKRIEKVYEFPEEIKRLDKLFKW